MTSRLKIIIIPKNKQHSTDILFHSPLVDHSKFTVRRFANHGYRAMRLLFVLNSHSIKQNRNLNQPPKCAPKFIRMTAVCDKQNNRMSLTPTMSYIWLSVFCLTQLFLLFFFWVGKTCVAISDKIFVGVLNHFPTAPATVVIFAHCSN